MTIKNDFIHERQWLSHDDKKHILKKTHNKCAGCGKELTMKTMTTEHIIPILRGGSYNIKNLIALCVNCNTMKGNMLYRPEGFYLYAMNEPCYMEMQQVFNEWFDTVYKDFNIQLYPLISPQFNTLFVPCETNHIKKQIITRQLILNWNYTGYDRYEEVNAITQIKINDLRKETNLLHENINCIGYANHDIKIIADESLATDKPVAVYSMQKLSTKKYLALISVLVDIESKTLSVYIPWTDLSSHYEPWAVYYFVTYLMQSIDNYAHVKICEIKLFSKNKNQLSYFMNKRHSSIIGIAATRIEPIEINDMKNANYVCSILRTLDEEDPDFEIIKMYKKNKLHIQLSEERQEAFRKRLIIANERYEKAHMGNY